MCANASSTLGHPCHAQQSKTFCADSTNIQWYLFATTLYHAWNYKNIIKMYEIALFRHLQLFATLYNRFSWLLSCIPLGIWPVLSSRCISVWLMRNLLVTYLIISILDIYMDSISLSCRHISVPKCDLFKTITHFTNLGKFCQFLEIIFVLTLLSSQNLILQSCQYTE